MKSLHNSVKLCFALVLFAGSQGCAYAQAFAQTQSPSSTEIRIVNQAGQPIGFLLGKETFELKPSQITSTKCDPGSYHSIEIRTSGKPSYSRPLLCGGHYALVVSQGIYVVQPTQGDVSDQTYTNIPNQQIRQPPAQQQINPPDRSYNPNIHDLLRKGM